MADAKITALNENTSPASTDLLAIVDDPTGSAETQKITLDNARTELGPKLSQATGNLSSASFDDTEVDLTWSAFEIDQTDCTLSGTEITINKDGIYKFTVTLRTDSGNRTELFIKTYVNTGAGYAQNTAAIVSDYVSRDADQDTGSVTLTYALDLDDGDTVKFAGFGDTDGACIGLDAGTVLIIEQF